MSCGPACVCYPAMPLSAPKVILPPRPNAKKLAFVARFSTKNPIIEGSHNYLKSKQTIPVESDQSNPSGTTCAACSAGTTFGVESTELLTDISDNKESLGILQDNEAFKSICIDLLEFAPGTTLTGVAALPPNTISFHTIHKPISPPRTPEENDLDRNSMQSFEECSDLSSAHPPSFVQPHPPYAVFSAPIVASQRMTREGAAKAVYHVSIDVTDYPLPENEQWLVGGSFGVVSANDSDTVDEILELCNEKEVHAETMLRTEGGRWPTVWGDDKTRTLITTKYELLRWCSDVSSSPIQKSYLRVFAEYATNAIEKQVLLYLCSAEGQTAFCSLRSGPPVTLLHLMHAFPSARPALSHLLSVIPQLYPRWYSLSSDPGSNHGTLDFAFTVAEVPHYKGYQRTGVASGFLRTLVKRHLAGEKNIRIPMFRGLHANPFTKDFADTGPMILIGAGVGIAPFRGFVQRRVSSAKCAGKVYVIQGCRDQSFDGIYEGDLKGAEHCIVESQAGRKEYVQDEVVRQGNLIWRVMTEEGGRVYLCGAAKGFLEGVEKALRRVAVKYGNMSEEEAVDRWKKWQDPLDLRFIKEVW